MPRSAALVCHAAIPAVWTDPLRDACVMRLSPISWSTAVHRRSNSECDRPSREHECDTIFFVELAIFASSRSPTRRGRRCWTGRPPRRAQPPTIRLQWDSRHGKGQPAEKVDAIHTHGFPAELIVLLRKRLGIRNAGQRVAEIQQDFACPRRPRFPRRRSSTTSSPPGFCRQTAAVQEGGGASAAAGSAVKPIPGAPNHRQLAASSPRTRDATGQVVGTIQLDKLP